MRRRETWWQKYQAHVITLSLLAIGVPVLLGIRACWKDHVKATEAGVSAGTIVVGDSVLVFDEYHADSDSWVRVTSVDATTGQVTGKRVFDKRHGGCVFAAKGRVWCQFGAIALHDARTLATIMTAGDALAAAGIHAKPDAWLIDDQGRWWTKTKDGGVASVDPETGAASEGGRPSGDDAMTFEYGIPDAEIRVDSKCELTREISLDGVPWSARPGYYALYRGEQQAETTQREQVRYIDAQFLLTSDTHAPIGIAGEPVILSNGSLYRVRASGVTEWQTILGPCEAAIVVGDTLVIARSESFWRVTAFDLANGTVRWQVGY